LEWVGELGLACFQALARGCFFTFAKPESRRLLTCQKTVCSLFFERFEYPRGVFVKMNSDLSELEKEVVEIFVRLAGVLNLPRSVGELYGLLYISPKPLCIDDCMKKLKISKGSTSQGLKILRSFGAVNPVYMPGSRRDYFEAEAQLRKIVSGFINEQIRPHLENGKERMARIDQMIAAEEDAERKEFFQTRIERLQGWQKRANSLLPFALNFIKPGS
jgi:DNA-binding transcriptional regulator GbsR (MarR family)